MRINTLAVMTAMASIAIAAHNPSVGIAGEGAAVVALEDEVIVRSC